MRTLKIALLLALAACGGTDDLVSPRNGVYLIAEEGPVPRDPGTGAAPVRLRLVNSGGDARYVPACGDEPGVTVERRRGGAWESYASGVCPAILPAIPVAIEGGTERRFTVPIGEAGEYRFTARILTSRDDAEGGVATSNSVQVR
jgi:hypothetical protein